MRPTLLHLLADAADQGITITWATMLPGRRGAYRHATRTIILRAGMSDTLTVPTLMHELEHARRGDDGPQPPWVEARIDRTVASRLITPDGYRAAEAAVGPHPAALAVELDLPRWVIDAYQTTLRPAVTWVTTAV